MWLTILKTIIIEPYNAINMKFCCSMWLIFELLFSLFGVVWVFSGTVKETLLGWHGAFVGKIRKKAWQMTPLCIFWSVWKERNLLAFGNEVLSLQRLKHSYVCNMWSWVRVFIVLSPRSLVNFFEWLGCS